MRGDERSFPVRVHGPSGETRRHRTSIETGLLRSTEERRFFRRGLCQLSRGHGLEVTHVYQVVEYDPVPCFRRFGDAVSTARREGDVHSHKAIIADTMKLLGNSGYGKTITNVDRHRDVNYCTEKAASLMVNDRRFRQLDVVVDDAYEIEINKKTVTYTLPVHVRFFVLQYAKMRMLQFYYDFINWYLERPLFQYCEMDTDSAYLA